MKKVFSLILTFALLLAAQADAALRFAEDAAHTSADQGIMNLSVRLDTPASTAGTSGDYAALVTDAFGRLQIHELPKNTDGVSWFSYLDNNDTADSPSSSAATLYSLNVSNAHATTNHWVKVYNKATAATSADGPMMRIFVKAASSRDLVFPAGVFFSAGISIRCVAEAADNGTTGAGSNECTLNGSYK